MRPPHVLVGLVSVGLVSFAAGHGGHGGGGHASSHGGGRGHHPALPGEHHEGGLVFPRPGLFHWPSGLMHPEMLAGGQPNGLPVMFAAAPGGAITWPHRVIRQALPTWSPEAAPAETPQASQPELDPARPAAELAPSATEAPGRPPPGRAPPGRPPPGRWPTDG